MSEVLRMLGFESGLHVLETIQEVGDMGLCLLAGWMLKVHILPMVE